MRFQPIYDIAEICARKGVNDVVLCPGSRCAPLTIAFTRHPQITPRTFSDERSAGFIALGIAQQTNEPVAVVCTSGTAAYNLAPAVAEAFFSETPLVVITADRPTEWIAQHDGQTIFQHEIYGKHVKKYYQLPQDYEHPDSEWAINRVINEAINLSRQHPKGPVHINAPFREPLYPETDQKITFTHDIRIVDEYAGTGELDPREQDLVKNSWTRFNRILIVAGQQSDSDELASVLNEFSRSKGVPIVSDIISNLHGIEKNIRHADLFLGQSDDNIKQTLQPDLLITFGQSLVSKNVKLFLRKYKAREHWHIQRGGVVADPFKSVTSVFQNSPVNFFRFLTSQQTDKSFEAQKQKNFDNLWEIEERRVERILGNFFEAEELSELELVKHVLENIPEGSTVHLANSMSVRYANFIGLGNTKKNISVFSNRGTSGIDGCSSTSVGHCLSSGKPTFLITGDVAFFYDRNAFWHNYPLENLRVVLLNNHGGLIFNMIDGPAGLPEGPEYFITRQKLKAENLCREFGFERLLLDGRKKLKNVMKDFFDFDGTTKVLEFESDLAANRTLFNNLKQQIKKSYER